MSRGGGDPKKFGKEPSSVGLQEAVQWIEVLAIPRAEEHVAFAQDVADIVVNPEGKETTGGERFFEDSARALLTGVILHALYTETQPSLGSCLRLLSSPTPVESLEGDADGGAGSGKAAAGWTERATRARRIRRGRERGEPAAGRGHPDGDRGAGDGAVEAGAVRGPAHLRRHPRSATFAASI